MEYAKALGARLRAVRQQQDLSLHEVEQRSNGRWKAVVVGSYERADRGVSMQRLSELAAFYDVPVADLLPEDAHLGAVAEAPGRIVLDLEGLAGLDHQEVGLLRRFAATIQAQRGDYNGRVLTIRDSDLRTLALLYNQPSDVLTDRFRSWGVLHSDSLVDGEMSTAGTAATSD